MSYIDDDVLKNLKKYILSSDIKKQGIAYKVVTKITNKAKIFSSLNLEIHEIKDLQQDFYVDKIFKKINDLPECLTKAYIITMMNRYVIDKRIRGKESNFKKTSVEPDELSHLNSYLDDDSIACHPDNNYISPDMIAESEKFILNSEPWVIIIFSEWWYLEGGSLSAIAKKHGIKAIHYKVAILGLTLRGGQPGGAKSLDEYHKKTLIGKWLVRKYGQKILPLKQDFLEKVLKSLCLAAFKKVDGQE